MTRLLVLLLVLVGLAGCGSVVEPPPSAPSVAPEAAPQPLPVRVEVPGRNIDGPIDPLGRGVTKAGGFDNPPVATPGLGSWYDLGPRPGAQGPAVILAHINGGGKAGLFQHLDSVVTGDLIKVYRTDKSFVQFKVYRTAKVVKTAFPFKEVFADTDGSELRLISCGGDYDPAHRRYLDNLIAYAKLVPA